VGGNANGGVQDEHATGGSTRPSFSTAPRQRPPIGLTGALATLGKPLVREFLFYPAASVSRSWWAVACVLRGSLAYRGPM
jgi:hypothetical protein